MYCPICYNWLFSITICFKKYGSCSEINVSIHHCIPLKCWHWKHHDRIQLMGFITYIECNGLLWHKFVPENPELNQYSYDNQSQQFCVGFVLRSINNPENEYINDNNKLLVVNTHHFTGRHFIYHDLWTWAISADCITSWKQSLREITFII